MTSLLKIVALCLSLASVSAKPPPDKGAKGQEKKADKLARLAERLGDRTLQSVLDFLKTLDSIPHISHTTTTPPAAEATTPIPAAEEYITTQAAGDTTQASQNRREFRARVKVSPPSSKDRRINKQQEALMRLEETLQRLASLMDNPPPSLLAALADVQAALQGTTSAPEVTPGAAAERTTAAAFEEPATPAAAEPSTTLAHAEGQPAAEVNDATTAAPAPLDGSAGPAKRQFHEGRGSRGRKPAWYWRVVITLQRMKSLLEELLADIPQGNAYLAIEAAVDALANAVPFMEEEAAANPQTWSRPRYAQEAAGAYTTTAAAPAQPDTTPVPYDLAP